MQVSIIIPVRNKLDFTQKCLQSIASPPSLVEHEIIVVDNASDDGTLEFLQEKQKMNELTTIRNDPPLNFAASCNRGAKQAQGKYLLFLNNDTEAFPGWLDEMVKVAERSGEIGAVGAKLVYPDGTIQHAGVAFRHFRFTNECSPYHIFQRFPRYVYAVNKEREFQCVTGACLLTPKALFDELGGFDERFINCFEDVDYCLRLREKGYKVIYTPRAELIHHEGRTEGRNDHVVYSFDLLIKKWEGKLKQDDQLYLEPEGFRVKELDDGILCTYPGEELVQWWKAIEQLIDLKEYRLALEEISKHEMITGCASKHILKAKGRCFWKIGELELARQAFSLGLNIEPADPALKWSLAQVDLTQGKNSRSGVADSGTA